MVVLGIGIILLAEPLSSIFVKNSNGLKQAESFAQTLNEKTELTTDIIYTLQKQINRTGPRKIQAVSSKELMPRLRRNGISIYAFRNDQLIFWSDNKISPETARRTATLGTEIHHFENGWYRLVYFTDGIDEYVGAILISRTFPYSNEYLTSGFTDDFYHENIEAIHLNSAAGRVKLKADHQNFYLSLKVENKDSKTKAIAFAVSSILGGLLVLLGLFKFYRRVSHRNRFVAFVLFLIAVVALRYLALHADWPAFVAKLPAFDPVIYASSTISPSFADFIINTLLLLFLATTARKTIQESTPNQGNIAATSGLFGFFVTFFSFCLWVNYQAKDLVLDSSIPFELNDLTRLTFNSLLGVLSVGLLYFSTIIFADGVALFAKRSSLNFKASILIFLSLSLAWLISARLFLGLDIVESIWPVLAMMVVLLARISLNIRLFKFPEGAIFLVAFAFVAAHNFSKNLEIREHSERRVIAEKLAINDDPVAEVLYADEVEGLKRDETIRKLFEQEDIHSRETLEDYALSRYFTGYWSKYDINLYAFTADKGVWGMLPDYRPKSFTDLESTLAQYSEPDSIIEGFHFLYNAPDRVAYMAVIPLNYNLRETPDGYLILTFASTLLPQKVGFPNLLIDRDLGSSKTETQYSTARFSEGRLTNSRGDYLYPTIPNVFYHQAREENPFFTMKGFEHYVSLFNDTDLVVVSKRIHSPLDQITTVTYLCVIFGFLFSIGIALFRYYNDPSFFKPNLNRKVQALLVFLTLFTMLIFSFATKYYIEENYEEKNERLLSEKMHSILLELESKLSEEEELNYDMAEYLNRILAQFSVIFFTDVNLFDPKGNLISSSQMRMYNEGLISRKMDPTAYAMVNYLSQVEHIQDEAVGNLVYQSAYSPLFNSRGEMIGFVNLPYFARQTELTNEISSFLVSVVNLFVLVFVLSLVIALFISQWITLPLRSIRESLSAIELGKANRLVGYQGKDEIGLLVEEYNAKVSELEINAARLSQSERESAWREMAKQVAHEIKNPLTPMKLSVQHLERTMLTDGAVDKEKVKRVMANLVEHIDTLTAIANAFSGFAKMPKAKVEKINLTECVENAVSLFSGFDKVEFSREYDEGAKLIVNGDKDQLVRVFNNLLKNAVQSIPDERRGKVLIHIKEDDGGYTTEISDNGIGISEEERSKIFVPNFTTKTSGMGLGLAMSQKIIENFGGEISFTSQVNEGSTFRVWIPIAAA
jgi:signal transduction histidine kinase